MASAVPEGGYDSAGGSGPEDVGQQWWDLKEVQDEFSPEELELLEDYCSDIEAFENDAEPPPPDFSNVIVVDNLPKVPAAKQDKLVNYVTKQYRTLGELAEGGVIMPFNEEKGKTYGFAFITYVNPVDATRAITSTHGFDFDKKHKLRVYHYRDLEAYATLEDEFVAPAPKSYDRSEDLYSWLFDKACRDQFAVRYDRETEVMWGETKQQPVLEYGGDREKVMGKVWVEDKVHWSPMGTYLCTFHKRGVALWGGQDFRKITRFPHTHVHEVRFSDDERFIATWNGIEVHQNETKFPEGALIVWDVRTGARLREFSQVQRSSLPDFHWTADGKFLVRLANVSVDGDMKKFIRVYKTPGMGLLDKRAIKVDGARELQLSPTDNVMAWWAPEEGSRPACVSLCELPSKRVFRTKNLVYVKDCQMHWQSAGDFLCVQVTRTTRRGKTQFTSMELFRLRDKNVPIEMLKIEDPVIHFAWEPSRTRFSVIHGNGPTKFNVSFYDMGESGSKLQHLYTLPEQGVNRVYWSPLGQYVVLAAMENLNGDRLEFYDVDERKSLSVQEHYLCTHVMWDPSGRIVTTAVAQSLYGDSPMRYTMQNGYMLWTFQGMLIHDEGKEKLYQFQWRPRPPSLLDRKKREDVKANLKKSIARYQAADRRKANRRKFKKYRQRQLERQAFMSWVGAATDAYQVDRNEIVALQGYDSAEEECEYVDHTYEVVLGRNVQEIDSFADF